ncbi:HAD family hydrolase [Microlunatus ginsengisoli]|uniref:HAD family hydrolase n=1 Tax=Microlunatus ginsengisoli TaxID=363863 RepID=A0ABP6ZY19_9ACTN
MNTAPTACTGPPVRAIALDFDGVICDGSTECAVTTWNAWTGRSVPAGPAGAVPASFLDRFLSLRGYARQLGHFVVPLLGPSAPIDDQAAFDACFAAIPAERVDRFVAAAERYRATARRLDPQRWLAQHRVHAPALETLRALPLSYVVTAKDVQSVIEILAAYGLELEPDRIYGGLRDKLDALADVARRSALPAEAVLFVDDSVANVVAARAAGFDARWATWGFHTPDQLRTADALGLPRLALADLDDELGLVPAGR